MIFFPDGDACDVLHAIIPHVSAALTLHAENAGLRSDHICDGAPNYFEVLAASVTAAQLPLSPLRS